MNAIAQADYLPNCVDAEQALLGAIMLNNDAMLAIGDIVTADMMFEPLHSRLFEIMATRVNAGEAVTPLTIAAVLGPDSQIEISGDFTIKKYLAKLCSHATTVINAPDFAKLIKDAWARRRLINVSREIQARAMGGFDAEPIETLLEQADQELAAIRFGKSIDNVSWLSEAAEKAVAGTAKAYEGHGELIYETGVQTIDQEIGSLMAGDFVTILGASGHGKTALLVQIMLALSQPAEGRPQGSRGALFSQEMLSTQIARRIMAADTAIPTRRQRSGAVNQAEYEQLVAAAGAMRGIPILIDETPRQMVSAILRKARALKKRYDIKFIGVDHSRLIKPEHTRMSEIETITNAAFELQAGLKDLGLIGFLLAQPTREAQKSLNRWRLTDQSIFGGDVLKQCSDIVLSIAIPYSWLIQREPSPQQREEYDAWQSECQKWNGLAEFSAVKLRDGGSGGWQRLRYDGAKTRFSDL